MYRFIILSVLIILVFLASLSLAEIPRLINYQGMLTDNSGEPLSGDFDLFFRIYNAPSGGDKRWEENHSVVSVSEGLFNAILGSQSGGIYLDFSEEYWLEIEVNNDTMPERLQFTSVGYAYRSSVADYALETTPGSGSNWHVDNSVLYTNEYWGIARGGGAGNVLYGDSAHTHVNLGVACTTGTNGANHYHCIVGGGKLNSATDDYTTVGGGVENRATGWGATIAGGYWHLANGQSTTIGGGEGDTASADYATVAGGYNNRATDYGAAVGGGYDNLVSGDHATVSGGSYNSASSYGATVSGGSSNAASNDRATVSGGSSNTASGEYATVGGGYSNLADTAYTTVGGGYDNTASGNRATVGGGHWNSASGPNATVGGGFKNLADTAFATVGGGFCDTASGYAATVPGGFTNTASGSYSFAAGRRAKANHMGAFVWADGTDADFASTGDDQFLIRASGGVGIGTTDPSEKLDVDGTARLRGITVGSGDEVLVDGNGVLYKAGVSSRRYKENIRRLEVDPGQVQNLQSVRFEWKKTGEEDIGLIAEDVEEVVPDLVRYDDEGMPGGVRYNKLAVYLLEVVKSQQERIATLEKEIAELKR
jgi:hypothetical protein